MEKWHNRVAVVTGASAGIGATCCKYLVENGMIVVGLARRPERVEQIKAELAEQKRSNLHALKCDVRNEAEIVRVFAEIESKFGPVAVLVNNAGIVRSTELVRDDNTEDISSVWETNVMGVAFCTREAFRSMKKNGGDGHVILINSIAGHKVAFLKNMSMNMYAPSKHAITAMTEVYRQEFMMNDTKVKVTSISPGAVKTEIFSDEMLEILKDAPFLRAEDIADAVVYCLQTPPHVQIHELTIKPVGEMF